MSQPAYHLSLMGGVRVSAGQATLPVRNRKLRAVFGYLALVPGARASRERLVGMLWGDRGEAHARASLRQALLDLRQTAPGMADLLLSDRLDLALADGAWAADVLAIEAAIAANDLATLAGLLATADGPLLAGLEGLAPAFDDWLLAERTRREAQLAAGALAVAEAAATHHPQAARAVADALGRLWPGEEAAARLGMRLDHAAGDLAAMHRRYRQLERALKAELDAEPASETRALMAELAARSRAGAERPAQVATGGIAGPALAQGPGGEAPVVVVTPLPPVPGDEGGAGLIAVLCHDLVAALQRLPDLRVLSLAHATPDRLERVGGRAIASYALSCSTRPASNGVRLTFSLSEIESGRAVWSHAAETPQARLGAAIGDAVERVAGAVLPTVERDLVRSHRLGQASPEAYALYLRGRIGVLTAGSHGDARRAAELLEQALAMDPEFINPRLQLTVFYNNDFLHSIAGHDSRPWRARALELATEATRIEPDNAHACALLGWCLLRRGDWESAERMVEQALALGPHHADTVEQCGTALLLADRVPRGREMLQRAFALNPFPRSDYFADMALADALDGRHAAAVAQFRVVPDLPLPYRAMEVACLGADGATAEAEASAERLRDQFRSIWVGPAKPGDADLLRTLQDCLPLRAAGHRDLLAQGLRAAGIADQPAPLTMAR